jgi:hypothetical protein
LSQGLPKKIEFYLLLADLALQLADALARRHKVIRALKIENPKALARAACRPQRLRSPRPIMPAPSVKVSPPDP